MVLHRQHPRRSRRIPSYGPPDRSAFLCVLSRRRIRMDISHQGLFAPKMLVVHDPPCFLLCFLGCVRRRQISRPWACSQPPMHICWCIRGFLVSGRTATGILSICSFSDLVSSRNQLRVSLGLRAENGLQISFLRRQRKNVERRQLIAVFPGTVAPTLRLVVELGSRNGSVQNLGPLFFAHAWTPAVGGSQDPYCTLCE